MEINIGIAEQDRAAIAEGLSRLLADTYTLYLKTHNFHWNVTGPMFNTLHLMFEGQYTELSLAVDQIAGRFLSTVTDMLLTGACRARNLTGLTEVCLSGGTFLSARLLREVTARLTDSGFRVYRHRAVPTGDGGIALGQAMVARGRWQAACV